MILQDPGFHKEPLKKLITQIIKEYKFGRPKKFSFCFLINGVAVKLKKNNISGLELKKHVYAIHCANSLTLLERKLFNVLLYNAYHELPHQSQFKIQTKELCNKIGYHSNDTSKIKKALISLMSTVIEWNILDDEILEKNRKWQASSILASAKLEQGICSYEYSSVMREQLYHPDIYGKLKLDTLSKFNSGYGLALYENCVRFQNLEYTPWFPLPTFRKLMGVSENQYIDMRNFKKRVLEIAINEVNKNATLNVTPEYKKEGRKIQAIRFKLSYSITNDTLLHFMQDDLVKDLTEIFSLSQEQINHFFEQYEKGYISQKIKIIIESENYINGKIKDMAAYLKSALDNDYQKSISSKTIRQGKMKKTDLDNYKKDINFMEDEKEYSFYKKEYVAQFIATNLTEKEHEKLIETFLFEIIRNNSVYADWYKRYKFKSAAIQLLFSTFLMEKYPGNFKGMQSLEEFKQSKEQLRTSEVAL